MVISSFFFFLSEDQGRICFHILARNHSAPRQALPWQMVLLGLLQLLPFSSVAIFGKKDRILLCFMIPARKSLLETVLHCVITLLSMVGSAAGREHICQAVYSAPSPDPEGLWEHSASPATEPMSQSQSKHKAFPPDLSNLLLNLWAYAVLI